MAGWACEPESFITTSMRSPHPLSDQIFALSSKIRVLPVVHGSGNMAQMVREVMVSHTWDCLAVPLPPSMEDQVSEGVAALPVVSVVVLPEDHAEGAQRCSYVPIDPCQPVIMGIRVAHAEGLPCAFVDREVNRFEASGWQARILMPSTHFPWKPLQRPPFRFCHRQNPLQPVGNV